MRTNSRKSFVRDEYKRVKGTCESLKRKSIKNLHQISMPNLHAHLNSDRTPGDCGDKIGLLRKEFIAVMNQSAEAAANVIPEWNAAVSFCNGSGKIQRRDEREEGYVWIEGNVKGLAHLWYRRPRS